MNIEQIRQLLRDNPRTQDGYCEAVRDAAAGYARQRRDQGATWREIEAEVGISNTSMRKWSTVLQPARFEQVVVVDDEPAPMGHDLVITSPSGFTLTGCNLKQAAFVLRSLR